MNSKAIVSLVAIATFASLAIPVRLFGEDDERKHHRYRLVDVGTFGGPDSYFTFGVGLNNRGAAAGAAATPTPDPFNPICIFPDCFVGHAFRWQDGVATDLGALPGANNSGISAMNANGVVAGVSENGSVDPVIDFPELNAIVWQDGEMINLGTFGGTFSQANGVNDRGEVVGFATNTVPVSNSVAALGCFVDLALPTQTRAFLWRGGALQDLGTLGGTDSCAEFINERGQVAGISFTDSTANPPIHSFLWHHGKMRDFGTLGGSFSFAGGLNNWGQVAGISSLAGDSVFHPFISHQGGLSDLATLGGDNGSANSLNDAGEVIGEADLPGSQTHHAFLWRHGAMTDLGTQDGDPCSDALSINSRGQIVGASTDCSTFLHAFLWEKGGPMIDLNSFVPANSNLILTVATLINDRGEIAVQGVLPNGDTHAVLLVPCDEEHGDREGCEDEGASPGAGVVRQALPSRSLSRATRLVPAWQRRGHFLLPHAGDTD